MKPIKPCIVLILALSLIGCASFFNPTPQEVNVTLPDPNRISFQGKGAGAGMALMSTMGPMGIALGVAIDEGIAKDLRKSAETVGFDIQKVISQAVLESSQEQWEVDPANEITADLEVRIKLYGFKTTGGADDATSAEIEAELIKQGKVIANVHYPNDFGSEDNSIDSYPLDTLKQEGVKAKRLLDEAIHQVITKLIVADV